MPHIVFKVFVLVLMINNERVVETLPPQCSYACHEEVHFARTMQLPPGQTFRAAFCK